MRESKLENWLVVVVVLASVASFRCRSAVGRTGWHTESHGVNQELGATFSKQITNVILECSQLKTPVQRTKADDPRMIAGTAVWVVGSVTCFLDLAIYYSSERPSPRVALLATGLTLLALTPIYRRIRSKEFLLGIGAGIAMLVLGIGL